MCQTGSALTSDLDDRARAIDTILKEGVVVDGVVRKLDLDLKSPLVERDTKRSAQGQPVDWCGRDWLRKDGLPDSYTGLLLRK